MGVRRRRKWTQSHALWEAMVFHFAALLTAIPKGGFRGNRRNQKQGVLRIKHWLTQLGAKNALIPRKQYLNDFTIIMLIVTYIWYRQLELSAYPKQEATEGKTTSSCLKGSRHSQHQLCNCSLSLVPWTASLVCKHGALWITQQRAVKLLAK